MIKLGVSYAVFSGLDLLKPSIQNIKPFASHITVVWSPISSTGEKIADYALDLLNDLYDSKLIDELIRFDPKITNDPVQMQDNCRLKREIGRLSCVSAHCTHHLIRDCDEFHDALQMKQILDTYPTVDCTLSRIREYIRNPFTRIKKISDLYVPFIQLID